MRIENTKIYGLENAIRVAKFPMAVTTQDLTTEKSKSTDTLASSNIGEGHDNFLNGIIVQFDLTATNKFWVEFQRYHFADFISSQSTMHRICKFDLDKSYCKYVDKEIIEIMKRKVEEYNELSSSDEHKAEKYLEVLYSNPAGFELTAGITTNYRQLKTMYLQRKDHRLPEWREFCAWIRSLPNAEWLI